MGVRLFCDTAGSGFCSLLGMAAANAPGTPPRRLDLEDDAPERKIEELPTLVRLLLLLVLPALARPARLEATTTSSAVPSSDASIVSDRLIGRRSVGRSLN